MNSDDEIPKYKKKSNKIIRKSKHKHIYEKCILHELDSDNLYISDYCILCGKISGIKIPTEILENKFSKMLSNKEILEKFKCYPIKTVNDIFKNKYILK